MPKKKIEITLKLSESDWGEIYYALTSKRAYVRNHHYGDSDFEINVPKWIDQLNRIIRTVKQTLFKNKVSF